MTAARLLPALLLVATLAACGDTLVDHTNERVREGPGGNVCTGTDISCAVSGQQTCVTENELHCGACLDCTVGFSAPHPSALPFCSVAAGPGSGVCTYECAGGLLKCTAFCCPAASLAAGAAHTCAITPAGALYCWGENGEGQVTGAAGADVLFPLKRFESGVTAVAAGAAHACAVVSGDVRCWGRNLEQQAPANVPTAASATALAAGVAHTCAVVGAGVLCWGNGSSPALVAGTSGATAVAAGDAHTCAILAGGRVVCWGENDQGQLGDGTLVPSPTPVEAIASGIAILAAGGKHTCAATEVPSGSGSINDALLCWGDAPGPPFVPASPQTTPAIPMRGDGSQSLARDALARVAAGRTHTCFQKAGDSILCFGPVNNWNQLGDTPEPGREAIVPGSLGATAFAAGADHSCAVFADGGVRCWGLNSSGQLGNGTNTFPGASVELVLGR